MRIFRASICLVLTRFIRYLRLRPSLVVIALICLTVTEVHLNLARHRSRAVIAWDVMGYYSYLPATFIEQDLRLSFITPENEHLYQQTRYAYHDDRLGHHILKYPMGMAILYAPFFFTAHLLAGPLGEQADGYSEIYHLCIEYSGVFYLCFGMLFLRRLLLLYVPEPVAAGSMLLIFFATNLLCYSTIDPGMSHSYSFSLFAVLLYVTARYYRHPRWQAALAAGILVGLLILVRPPNAMLGLVIPLYGVYSLKLFRDRLRFWQQHYRHLLILVGFCFLVMMPQFLYWHYVSGHYLVFSYGEEGFFFGNPHIAECLLGFRKGWLIYSPVCFFALGALVMTRHPLLKDLRLPSLIIGPIYLYVVASWWCWWYGGSFGQRAMIDLYPLLCLALAAWLVRIRQFPKPLRWLSGMLLTTCLILNIYQTFQYKYNIIHYDAMTARAYVNVFGKMERSAVDTTLLDHPDYARALKGLGN